MQPTDEQIDAARAAIQASAEGIITKEQIAAAAGGENGPSAALVAINEALLAKRIQFIGSGRFQRLP